MPYQSSGKRICSDCFLKLDLDFFKVRDYLYEHDRAGIEEVHEATGVSRKSILYLLKEERLIVGDEKGGSCGFLTCESCKRPINTGRLCAGCKNQVLSAIQESVGTVNRPKKLTKEMIEESLDGVAKLQLR